MLKLRQRKHLGQEPECNRRLVHSATNRRYRGIQDLTLPWSQLGQVGDRKPGVNPSYGGRSPHRDQPDEANGDVCLGRMAPGIPKCAHLLDPGRVTHTGGPGNARSGCVHRLIELRHVPGKCPLFAAFRGPAEEHSKLARNRGQKHDVDRIRWLSDFAIRHYMAN